MIFEGINIQAERKPIRFLRLRIRRDGSPALSIPLEMSEERVQAFLEKHRTWLVEKTAAVRARHEQEQAMHTHTFDEGETFVLLGERLTLRLEQGDSAARAEIQGAEIILSSPRPLALRQRQRLVESLLARAFLIYIEQRVAHWLPVMHEAPVRGIGLRNVRSRWGACQPARRLLTFSTRLAIYPRETVEAIIVHELCHLKEPSHNRRFHALMAHYLPDYKERERALRGSLTPKPPFPEERGSTPEMRRKSQDMGARKQRGT